MMNAYVTNNEFEQAKLLFNTMCDNEKIEIIPDTYSILLNGCSHIGNINEANDIWNNFIMDDNIKYDCYVMTIFIDCLSRNGQLNDAVKYIEKYENFKNNKPDHIMWISLLNGCKKFENNELGKYAYKKYVNEFGENKIYRKKLDTAFAMFAN
eukprot:328694_1